MVPGFYTGLIALVLVHHIQERFAGQVATQVLREECGGPFVILPGVAGDMRGDENIWEVPEWTLRGQRLVLKDIQSRAGDLLLLKRTNQVVFVTHFSTGNIHQEGA